MNSAGADYIHVPPGVQAFDVRVIANRRLARTASASHEARLVTRASSLEPRASSLERSQTRASNLVTRDSCAPYHAVAWLIASNGRSP